ncbi:MAG: sugar phosphate isomerase/epimerase family protein [Anaerolineaceae bacterium]
MFYTGFSDEAGDSINEQIDATLALGWHYIESRSVNKQNITDIPEIEFDLFLDSLQKHGIKISCFGSAIANWSTHPRSEIDYENSLNALRRAIPRMQKAGTRFIRGMSFGIARDEKPDSPELEKIIYRKVQSFVNLCEEAGIIYLHENCMNYGGLSFQHTMRLLEAIKSPNLRLVFDTGNPVGSDHHVGSPPYQKQNSWEFYKNVREFIDYVHIKDCILIAETGGIFPELKYTFPGEGDGQVKRIVKDLLKNGYDGGFSIEPHLSVIHHKTDDASPHNNQFNNYVSYGQKFMEMVNQIQIENNHSS